MSDMSQAVKNVFYQPKIVQRLFQIHIILIECDCLCEAFCNSRCVWKDTPCLAAPYWSTSDSAAGSGGQACFRLLTQIQCSHSHVKAMTSAQHHTDYLPDFWSSICSSLCKPLKNGEKKKQLQKRAARTSQLICKELISTV